MGLIITLFAIWRRGAELRLARSINRKSSLHANATAILRARDGQAIADQLVRDSMELTGASAGLVAAPLRPGRPYHVLVSRGWKGESWAPWVEPGTPVADAFYQQHSVLLGNRVRLAADYASLTTTAQQQSVHAVAAIPLTVRNQKRLGVMFLAFPGPMRFGRDEAGLLVTLANQAALGLDDADFVASVNQQTSQMHVLSESSLAMSESELQPGVILERVTELCSRYIGDWAVVHTRVEGTDELERTAISYTNLEPSEVLVPRRLKVGDGMIGSVASTAIGRILNLPAEAPDALPSTPQDEATTDTSILTVPIILRGEVFGTLTVGRSGPQSFQGPEAQLALEVATRAGLALIAAHERADALQELELRRQAEKELLDHQDKLKEALAVKDEFLGLVSHELRTPLTIIRGNASVLRRHPGLPESVRAEAIEDLASGSERLNRIVENMLLLARLDVGKLPELEPVLLAKTIRQAISDFSQENPQADIRVVGIEETLIVDANEEYVRQILQNLFSNAVKYSLFQSAIEVTASRDESTVTASVADRGIGIDPEHVHELFTPFYRENQSSPTSGMGIGLTVCKRLIEAQGGSISARARKGGGSVFSIVLTTSQPSTAEDGSAAHTSLDRVSAK